MNNYYDLLNISQEANQSEIETVLDDQYTKWRALVTHHDNNVVAQAKQALSQLEEIRNTLMNPEKRRAYNNSLLANQGNVAGLADPDILLSQNPMGHVMARSRPRVSGQTAQAEMDRTDAWICTNPNCKKANPIGTQFCVKCGTRIGLECPSCGEFVEISNKFCSSCGVNKAEYFKKVQAEQIQSLQEQIKDIQAEIQEAEANPKKYFKARTHKLKQVTASRSGSKIGSAMSWGGGIIWMVGGIAEDSGIVAAIGFLLLLIGIVLSIHFKSSMKLEKVTNFIQYTLKPRLEELRGNISKIQNQRYGS